MKDKNGRGIYDGDIVKTNKYQDALNTDKFLIGFERGAYWLLHKNHLFHTLSYFMDEIEVIGNIHDNPELLDGKE